MTVAQVKQLVYAECPDLTPNQQKLKWQGKTLLNEVRLSQCGIFPGGAQLELHIRASLGTLCGLRRAPIAASKGGDDEKVGVLSKQWKEQQEQKLIEQQTSTAARMRSDAVKGGYAVMSCVPGRRHFWIGMTMHPEGDLRQRWDLLIALLVIISVWIIPLTVAFQEELEAAVRYIH